MNLASVIDAHPDQRVALVPPGGEPVTYGALRRRVAGLRGGLAGLGVEAGDRVALLSANSPAFVEAYLAILGIGSVAVPLNPHSPPLEMERELAAVGARAVVAGSDECLRAVAAIDRAALPDLAHVVAAGSGGDGALSLDEVAAGDPVDRIERDPSDVAALVFTSGTAGAPRAAMLTHGNLLANIDQLRAADVGQSARDVALGALPMFHIYGLNVVLGVALASGHATVLVDRFDATATLEVLREHGVTVVPGVPTMWSAWARLPATAAAGAFAGVRLATSGAAPLDPAVRRALRERFDLSVVEGYGLTEASPAVTTGLGVDAPDGSVGVPLPGVSIRLVDVPSGDDALVGDPGEMWVRGPNVFPGYWGDTHATTATLTDDGWLRTGDVALVDDKGLLYLVDRAKDLIIVSGFNVFPAEVEEVLESHPTVAEAAVVGTPDPRTGESVAAYVVPAGDAATLDEGELVAHCSQRLARYKCPTTITVVDELPHGLTGKILRRELGRP